MADSQRPLVPGTIPFMAWTASVEVDVQTALSLSRASAQALIEHSPELAQKILGHLKNEMELLETDASPAAQAAACSIKQILDEAA